MSVDKFTQLCDYIHSHHRERLHHPQNVLLCPIQPPSAPQYLRHHGSYTHKMHQGHLVITNAYHHLAFVFTPFFSYTVKFSLF